MIQVLNNHPNPAEHIAKFGGWNTVPPNFEEITPEQFAAISFWAIAGIEFRQFHHNNKHFSGYLFFVKGVGFDGGYAFDTRNGGVKFYRFSDCKCETESKSIGNCLHLVKCKKCGREWEVDSSG